MLQRFLPDGQQSMHPRTKLILGGVALACLLILVSGILLSPVAWFGNAETKQIVIPSGTSALDIARLLKEAGLIRSSFVFHVYGRLSSSSGRMQAGVYEMSPHESAYRLMDRLRRGDTTDLSVTVTIPEGYTSQQIAQTLEEKGIVSEAEFLDYLATAPLPYPCLQEAVQDLEPEKRLEGYLFPDTYRFVPGTSAAEVVQVMTQRFQQVIEDLVPAEVLAGQKMATTPVPLDLSQLVTLASIVEREAVASEERATIAGVFYNRLRIKQPLQSCATVQYALGVVKPVLSEQDTLIDSPYNTYQRVGLSPGPIANPGRASLQAVIQPVETPYYYFVALNDGSGKHIFSKTFAEHRKAAQEVRQR